jgi:hypothetical protein
MIDLDDIVQAFFALFIVVLLGYVFINVFFVLSPTLAVLFGIVVVVVVAGILYQIFKG